MTRVEKRGSGRMKDLGYKQLVVWLEPKEHKALCKLAAKLGGPISHTARSLLRDALIAEGFDMRTGGIRFLRALNIS